VAPAQGPSGLQPVTLLGRYQVGKVLGKGAMGVVYLGQDTQAGRVVALKTMALSDEFEGANLLDARERFFREAQTAGRLKHPNIVSIHDSGEDQGLTYIAMEFVEGQDLMAYCKRDHLLALPVVISIVARVAEALACAHAHNVVHRDIKPANVMFDIESDTLKVMDFGIARITDANKTRTGLILGTPSFMSPEQLAGKKVDGRSDLYSLGVMLFMMLTGTLPFRANSLAALMHKITHERAPDISDMLQNAPSELADLVAKALEKDPQLRYQDGKQMALELRALLLGKILIDLEI
jgi:serine/threonine-protein kinase